MTTDGNTFNCRSTLKDGASTVLFLFYWHRYLYDVPDNHPNISPEEYEYLKQNVGMSDESGYLYCIPFILTFLTRIFNTATYITVKNFSGLSDTMCRKLYTCFGCLMVIISLLSIIFEEKITKLYAIVAISINLALGDFVFSGGFFPTLLDLAPNYAGLLSGLSTCIALWFASPSTSLNSIIIEQNTKEEWNIVLWIIVAIYAFIMFFYLIFGSAKLQLWSIGERGTFQSTL